MANFQQIDVLTIYRDQAAPLYIVCQQAAMVDAEDLIRNPQDHAHETILEAVEEFAGDEGSRDGLITDEQDCSDRFDSLLEEANPAHPEDGFDTSYFNDWADSETKNGTMHSEQYQNYEYVGQYDK